VFIEMNRKEPVRIRFRNHVYGRRGRFSCRTNAPEDPGPYAFRRGALDHRRGSAHASRSSSNACGGRRDVRLRGHGFDGDRGHARRGARALPEGRSRFGWVSAIARFRGARSKRRPSIRSAQPYSQGGSRVDPRFEDVNFNEDGKQREIWAYAISAKRTPSHARSRRESRRDSRRKGARLGIYLNPIDPSAKTAMDSRDWEGLVREALAVLDSIRLGEFPRCGIGRDHGEPARRSTILSASAMGSHEAFNFGYSTVDGSNVPKTPHSQHSN